MISCPNCLQRNPQEANFCQYCRTDLSSAMPVSSPQSSPLLDAPSSASLPAFSPTEKLTNRQNTQPTHQPLTPMGQVGADGKSAGSVWSPFAGYGERGRHVSWLLDNLGDKTDVLHRAISNRFEQRNVPRSDSRWATLTGQGLVVEKREFFFIRRGITTVALYIAQFGKDLYISQVTYAKGPINYLRLAVLGLMLLFYAYISLGFSNTLADAAGTINFLNAGNTNLTPFFTLLCLVAPLGFLNTILLFLAVIYSIYKFVREKDFFALLRTPPNEFQLDDIIALEKSVEETVRQSLDEVGIDAALMPAAREYGFRRRLV